MKELLINLITKIWHRASLSYTTKTGRLLTTLPRVERRCFPQYHSSYVASKKKLDLLQHFAEEYFLKPVFMNKIKYFL